MKRGKILHCVVAVGFGMVVFVRRGLAASLGFCGRGTGPFGGGGGALVKNCYAKPSPLSVDGAGSVLTLVAAWSTAPTPRTCCADDRFAALLSARVVSRRRATGIRRSCRRSAAAIRGSFVEHTHIGLSAPDDPKSADFRRPLSCNQLRVVLLFSFALESRISSSPLKTHLENQFARRRPKPSSGKSRFCCGMASAGYDLSQFDISKEEKDKLVGEVMRYVLFKTHQNSGCPIKREELTQLVTRNYRNRNLPALVINEAREKLSSVFGYEMRELQKSRPSTNQTRSSQSSSADSRSYVLMSQLPAELYRRYVEDVNTAHLSGFTFVVISIVHLAGGKIPEDNLWHHLRRLGLHETDENHQEFGNVKQALEALVQQRYLQKDKVTGPEGSMILFELAERALDARIIEKIKENISQVVKKDVTYEDAE
ncbi:hypothetical protein NL676_024613 [Syzygium grande]|nr:hypothetical protein NL676_024613 [Syzygium grande]